MQHNAFILLATALFCSSTFSVLADNPARYVIASPDHPGTWEVGANDKLSQELHWDSAKRLLLLNVVYAYVPYSERWDPTEQEAYTVRFPNVLCDETRRQLLRRPGDARKELGKRPFALPWGRR